MPSSVDLVETLLKLIGASGVGPEYLQLLRGATLTARGLEQFANAFEKGGTGSTRQRRQIANVARGAASQQVSEQRQGERNRGGIGRGGRGTGIGSGGRGRGGGAELPAGGGFGQGGVVGAIPLQRVASSNVYAIGYDYDTGTLRVQFKAPQEIKSIGLKLGGGPGSIYDYYDVLPRLWESFQAASSKGKWIWDNMRIRGTISGHQYDYRLVTGITYRVKSVKKGFKPTGVYVARLATGKGLERRTRIVSGKKFRSQLASQRLDEGTGTDFFRGR